ncbi:hypothetical protein [Tepidibacter hydrothermalis]|uniref:Bypass of forespore C C-terminal domain-containing protein n=1 Tax=Tepidibacter hydrothermalis TaxID=3036126 RepID=A0ABY8E8P4_9FIRM|nr:hypothetical protein [Tepidibacter hydrothermalis]WFD09272.1 hypothetical protein P4S50_12855 [Tepidibacter hydrothermalis]
MFEKKRSSKIPILLIAILTLVGGFYMGKMLEEEDRNTPVTKTVQAEEEKKVEIEAVNKKDEILVDKDAVLKITTKYDKCEHVETTENPVSKDIIGLSEKEFKEYMKKNYSKFRLLSFKSKEINLLKEIDSYCDKHYEIGEDNGYIIIYKYDEKGNKNVVEKTEFSITALPSIDQEQIKSGLILNSLEELNERLEDFGS